MTLQEAEQYGKEYKEAIREFGSYLNRTGSSDFYVTREEHRRKEADPTAENEIIVRDPSQKDGFTAREALLALELLLDEYENLQRAVAYAKLQAETDIDRAEKLQELRIEY